MRMRRSLAKKTLRRNSAVPKAKKTVGDEEAQKDPPILNPLLSDVLVKIANMLDPASFLRFSETCRALHNFCLVTKGIKIPCETANIVARAIGGENFVCSRGGIYIDSSFCRMPFRFRIASFSFPTYLQFSAFNTEVNADFIAAAREFLNRIRASAITCIHLDLPVHDWKAFALFTKDYAVQEMWFYPVPMPRSPLEAASPLRPVRYSAEGFFEDACVAEFYSSSVDISQQSLRTVVEKWATGSGIIRHWELKTSLDELSFFRCFSRFAHAYYDSPELPSRRPLVLVNRERREHWILRENGDVLCCKMTERADETISSLSLNNDDTNFAPTAFNKPILDFSLDLYDFGDIEYAFANLPI